MQAYNAVPEQMEIDDSKGSNEGQGEQKTAHEAERPSLSPQTWIHLIKVVAGVCDHLFHQGLHGYGGHSSAKKGQHRRARTSFQSGWVELGNESEGDRERRISILCSQLLYLLFDILLRSHVRDPALWTLVHNLVVSEVWQGRVELAEQMVCPCNAICNIVSCFRN